jgi:PAS domain S-box-containing protein
MTAREIDAKKRRELRKNAERQIKGSARVAQKPPRDDVLKLIHELEVHQVELELQNEELKRSQSELEESRKKYFDLYDLAPVGYVTLNRQGIIREINLAGAELLGRNRARLKGNPFERFVARSSRNEFQSFCRRLFAGGGRQDLEVTLAHGERAPLNVLLAGVVNQDGDGSLDLCRVTMTDITARKSAESWVQNLIETSQDAVISIDRKAQITLFNTAAKKMFGYAAEEVLGKKIAMLMPESYAGEHDGYIALYERTGEKRAIGKIREVTARRKNGEIFPIELSVTEVDDSNGVRYVAYIRDVSEKAQLQAQLVERARLAVIDETTAMVAHEIANPLHGMTMSLQLLERHLAGVSSEPVMVILKRVNTEMSRLKNLLYDFRALSMQENYSMKPTALASLIEEFCASQKPNLDAAGIRVELELQRGLPDIFADAAKIKQVLLNLCKNAEEAMPEGGTITVRVYESDRKVMVEVRDPGIGLPADFKLESPFKTTKPAGTGLGLVIVRQIVSRHQGSLSYASKPGKGTTFTVGFPIHSVTSTQSEAVVEPKSNRGLEVTPAK